MLQQTHLPAASLLIKDVPGVSLDDESCVGQRRLLRSPAALELDQTSLFGVGPPQVKRAQAQILGVPNRFPVQQVHRSKIVEAGVGASVLVDQRVLVGLRQSTL